MSTVRTLAFATPEVVFPPTSGRTLGAHFVAVYEMRPQRRPRLAFEAALELSATERLFGRRSAARQVSREAVRRMRREVTRNADKELVFRHFIVRSFVVNEVLFCLF